MDSVWGWPNLLVYMMVILSLMVAKLEGHMVIQVQPIMAPTMWPGKKTSQKWCESESDFAQASARKSIAVGSLLKDVSPGTTSNPDGVLSTGMSSGKGVVKCSVKVGAVDILIVQVILRGGPC